MLYCIVFNHLKKGQFIVIIIENNNKEGYFIFYYHVPSPIIIVLKSWKIYEQITFSTVFSLQNQIIYLRT